MKLLLVTLLASIGLPFLFQVVKKNATFLGGVPALVLYVILCGIVGVVIAVALEGANLITAAVCGLAIFMLSQGFYATVLTRYLPGRGSVG